MKSIGFIETRGLVASINAADSMLKAANVEIVGTKFVGGGLVAIVIEGDVGAVRSAIDAGASAAQKIGEIVSAHLISRPDDATQLFLGNIL